MGQYAARMEQQPRLPLWFLAANLTLVVVAFWLGVALGKRRYVELPQPQAAALELVYDEIVKNHVEAQDGQVLLDRAITAMAGKLDEYSEYVPPREVAKYDERSTGRYEGVGMRQVLHGEEMVVYYPFPGGPAERAGVRPGDRLLAVDDQELALLPKETREARTVELVRGAADTDVRLRLQRDDDEVTLTIRRGPVQQPSVKWAHFADPEQGLGYLYVADFHRGVAAEVFAAIANLRTQGPLRGLVIDLRFDGGGSLDECVELARAFQPTGTIVSLRRRNQVVETHAAEAAKCLYRDLPLVVLVNGQSASASEVFAGCLQDHHRAALVGARTYGKGVVNTVYSWPQFRLKLTTAHYFTPNGRNIEGHSLAPGKHPANGAAPTTPPPVGGIEPDVAVATTDEQLRALARTLGTFEPPATQLPAFSAVAEKLGIPVPRPPQAQDDEQLRQGLATLRERVAAAAQVAPATQGK